MANRIPPKVKLLFACEGAWRDPHDQKWVLKQPLTLVRLPPGTAFPFRVQELCVYVQLTDGLGSFDLLVEMCQMMSDGSRRYVGNAKAISKNFPTGGQLLVFEDAFPLKNVPFREAGIYEFRMTETEHGVLDGMTFEIRMLD